jgi:hypothetical protein
VAGFLNWRQRFIDVTFGDEMTTGRLAVLWSLTMMAHKFKIGQVVTLHSKRHGVWAEPFEVVRLLPHANGNAQRRLMRASSG